MVLCHTAMTIAQVCRWCWQPKKKNEQSQVLAEASISICLKAYFKLVQLLRQMQYSISFGSQIGATSSAHHNVQPNQSWGALCIPIAYNSRIGGYW
jgi:hypothetical protein